MTDYSIQNIFILHECIPLTKKYNFLVDLIDKYFELHPKDIDVEIEGYTSLMIAVRIKNIEIIKILLKHNPNLNYQNIDGMTALMYAVIIPKSAEVVKILLEHGANVNIQNKYKQTAIMFVMYSSAESIFNLILNNGANVNLQDHYGITPLMITIKNKATENFIKSLIEHDANINLKTNKNKSAITIAFEKNIYIDLILPNRKIFMENVLDNGDIYYKKWRVKCCDYKILITSSKKFREILLFM